MGKTAGLAPEQLAALGRIATLPQASDLHLTGGSAVAFHFGHRQSEDIDLFSVTQDLDLDDLRRELTRAFPGMTIRSSSDVTLKIVANGTVVDFVRYPYPPLEPPVSGPAGVSVAGIRDLAAMKLAAIAKRGIRRDFWDLYTMARAGRSLAEMTQDYLEKFGRAESDLYHVFRALTYFADAEADPILPAGMTPDLWEEIKTYFEAEAAGLIASSRED